MKRLSITLTIIMALSACQSTEVAQVTEDTNAKKTTNTLCKGGRSTGSRLKKRVC